MTLRGPVLTLLAVAVLSAGLYLVNVRTTTQTENAAQASAPVVTTQETTAVPLASPGAPVPPPTPDPTDSPVPPEESQQPVPPADPQQGATYAGRTSGDEATIAITTENGQAVAYVCDGKQIESWLTGTITDGELNLQGADGAMATGTVQGDEVAGTVWVQDKQWPYTAQLAQPPAGLYQGETTVGGEPAQVGWIVLPDGSQVGVAAVGEARRPAPPLTLGRPGPVLLDGSPLVPQPVDVDNAGPVVGPPS